MESEARRSYKLCSYKKKKECSDDDGGYCPLCEGSIWYDTVESFEGRKTDDQSHAEVGDEVVKPT